MRVLLSEGSSTSAREAVTVLGLDGHDVEICDPDPHCLGRFSRFVRKFHRCPGLRDDPHGYFAFIEALIVRERFDVLLPIHEQGYVFAAAPDRLLAHTRVALPSFASYRRALRKTELHRLLAELGLPQPNARIVRSAAELVNASAFPCVVKTAIGTASQGTWIVRDRGELARVRAELAAREPEGDELLVQDYVAGATERAQAVFADGRLVAMHAYRQLQPGAGGGDARKESVARAGVRADLERIGAHLRWHGALSVDYICADGRVHYIDCNPRLVEPMSAYLSGLDLVELLVQVSCGRPMAMRDSQPGVRTHLAMQSLLACGMRGGTRRDVWREVRSLVARTGDYESSREELTPLRLDRRSAVPAVLTAATLLVQPRLAARLPKLFGAHVLGARAAERIEHGVAA